MTKKTTADKESTAEKTNVCEPEKADGATVATGNTEKTKPLEPEYTAEEFIKAARRVFGVMPECAEAAFKKANKTKFTISQAKKIVKEFTERKVK